MNVALKADLARLSALAYHRVEWSGDLVRKFHRLSKATRAHADYMHLARLYEWLFVPITLWPIDLHGLFEAVLTRIESHRRLTAKIRLLLDLLPELPDAKAQDATKEHEHAVQRGDYASLLHAQHKFDHQEKLLARNARFKADWATICEQFDIGKFQDYKGIIRRRFVGERSIRHDWTFRGAREADIFREVFDVFCQRWNLYGMRGDQPLLTKLTVNLTPFGTMIFVPPRWSLDARRDLKWRAITALHRARGVRKQGPKLSGGQIEIEDERENAKRWRKEATTLGLKGTALSAWVMRKLGWDPRTDERKLRRLMGKR